MRFHREDFFIEKDLKKIILILVSKSSFKFSKFRETKISGKNILEVASLWCESNRDVSRMSEAKRDLSEFPHSFS